MVERLVVEEELDQEAQVLAIDLVGVAVDFEDRKFTLKKKALSFSKAVPPWQLVFSLYFPTSRFLLPDLSCLSFPHQLAFTNGAW